MDLEILVKGLEKKHVAGQDYLSELDSALQCEDIYQRVYDMVINPFRETFILTGDFGMQFLRWMKRTRQRYNGFMLFPGGMRDGVAKAPLVYEVHGDWYTRAVFVDDSIYSGTTKASCLQNLYVGEPMCYVAYDGMPEKDPTVQSLYRYHKEAS